VQKNGISFINQAIYFAGKLLRSGPTGVMIEFAAFIAAGQNLLEHFSLFVVS
jgi:hypothetical protein